MNIDKTLTKIFTLNETQPLPPFVTSPSSPLLPLFPDPSCVKLWIPSCLCRNHITLNLFYWVRLENKPKIIFRKGDFTLFYLNLLADRLHWKYRGGIKKYSNQVNEVGKFRNKTLFRQ